MNPFINPITSFSVLKDYLNDYKRLKKYSPEKMEEYRDKQFRKIVKYAYNVPLYHDKYKKAGIRPDDIKKIDDIKKLPFISKKDLIDNFPDNVLPINSKITKKHIVCTGGTTGKPVSIFTDFYTMIKASGAVLCEYDMFNLNWRKSKIAGIGNITSYRIGQVIDKQVISPLKTIFSMNNILSMDVNLPITKIMEKLDKFKPEVVQSYPTIHQHLAFLKRKGHGKNLNPRILLSSGSVLDNYTRSYVEDAFGCKLLNYYSSVESGAHIAIECYEGNWHIHSDFFHIEAINEKMKLVKPGEKGHLVITRLFGKGTPIIRYTGMDDWVKLAPPEKCNCGLCTPTLRDGVEGRMNANIVLPNGKIFPAGAFCFIEAVLHKFKTFKVKQYQVVQNRSDDIEILLVIDEDLRNVGAPIEEIVEDIKQIYQEKAGLEVEINVREVSEIKHPKDARKPAPIVISHVKVEEGYKIFEK